MSAPDPSQVPPSRGATTTIHAIAGGQHGVVARRQLVGAGLSPARIDNCVKRGELRPVHRGVYQVGPIALPHGRRMAAVLASGGRAVVTGRHGAELWRMPLEARPASVVEIINLQTRCRRHGVRGSRARLLDEAEITSVDGVPVASAARVLLDVAATATPNELERMLAFAERERLVMAGELQAQLGRQRRHPGRRALQDLIERAAEPALTLSDAEARLLALLRRTHLPAPATNVWLHGFKVDMYWESAKLVVEIDGFAFHSSRGAFERDRERTNLLGAHGVRVMRVTWRQIVDGYAAIAQIAQALTQPAGPERARLV